MYYIIETQEQLEKFSKYDLRECYVDVVTHNPNYHNAISPLSLVYIRPVKSRAGFILPIDHSESLSLTYESVDNLIRNLIGYIYAIDAKRLRYYFGRRRHVYCLKTALYLYNNTQVVESTFDTQAHKFLYQRYSNQSDINRVVPIAKHYEKLEAIVDHFPDVRKMLTQPAYNLYGKQAVDVFYSIESQGIRVAPGGIEEHFNIKHSEASLDGDKVFTSYNLYTATGRPSNAFNGLNFAALNKGDKSREVFIPSNDYFVEFDYSSYHLRILCELMEYTFDDSDIHRHLAKFYFNREEITDEEYVESKKMTFRLLYTESNLEELDKIPFFVKVREFKQKMWQMYKKDGYIQSPISGRLIRGVEIKTQILPYILQNYETERNIQVLSRIIKYLKDKKSSLILYCYDSFLIDYCKEDGKATLNAISDILEEGGYKTSCKYGKNYHDMKTI